MNPPCPSCGSPHVHAHSTVHATRGEQFEAQSFYEGEKVTTLPASFRCSRCGNQDFSRHARRVRRA